MRCVEILSYKLCNSYPFGNFSTRATVEYSLSSTEKSTWPEGVTRDFDAERTEQLSGLSTSIDTVRYKHSSTDFSTVSTSRETYTEPELSHSTKFPQSMVLSTTPRPRLESYVILTAYNLQVFRASLESWEDTILEQLISSESYF